MKNRVRDQFSFLNVLILAVLAYGCSSSGLRQHTPPLRLGVAASIEAEVAIHSVKARNIEEVGSDEMMLIYIAVASDKNGNSIHAEQRVKRIDRVVEGDLYSSDYFDSIQINVPVGGHLSVAITLYEIDDHDRAVEIISAIRDYSSVPLGFAQMTCGSPEICLGVLGVKALLVAMEVSAKGINYFDSDDLLGEYSVSLPYSDLQSLLASSEKRTFMGSVSGVRYFNSYDYGLGVQVACPRRYQADGT